MTTDTTNLASLLAEGAWRICGSVGAVKPYPWVDPNQLYFYLINGIQLDKWNRTPIQQLAAYFSGDVAAMEKMGIDAGKNLYLHGPTGCGKSSIMDKLWRFRNFTKLEAKILAGKVVESGFTPLYQYGLGIGMHNTNGLPPELFIDDVGWEPTVNHKGTVIEVMDEMFCHREKAFNQYSIRTILVSNNPPEQVLPDYGDRSYSRLAHYNIISFPEGGPNRRLLKKIELVTGPKIYVP
ncbi:hypothetical protein K3G39_13865 [Pontibacter sp. HSC-14F20]|uniref:hypothetical protein n=1 Tax=Pontibacter sp. HSC-14F20 TaxID=2864136 RepID=UPI001C7397B1|nr:hypothetical protein [Pontibacter sp. HSC-14F20]MBX0334325.1 hypothetical protein [Pontibacter sp. HSC-14F20]